MEHAEQNIREVEYNEKSMICVIGFSEGEDRERMGQKQYLKRKWLKIFPKCMIDTHPQIQDVKIQ